MIFSIIFENIVSEIGLYLETSVLSPFLYRGFTSEYFNLSGNVPVDRILLDINIRGDKK